MIRSALRLSLTGVALLSGHGALGQEPATGEPRDQVVQPKAADADAPLPEGFPGATAPGTIEVKSYPAYRSAVARGQDLSVNAGDTLFFSLFNHISRRGVEMTAPVINTYGSEKMIVEPNSLGEVSMEFLYERPDQGEAGAGVGIVRVEDHEPITVVSLGLQGRMSDSRMKDGLEELRAWLDSHADTWKVAGPPRRLGYHGPMTPVPQRLWEIQIPIAPVAEADRDSEQAAPSEATPVQSAPDGR